MKSLNATKQGKPFKKRLFSAYEHILELNIVGPYIYFILTLIETFQLLYLTFALSQDSDDTQVASRMRARYTYFTMVFKVFLYVPYILEMTSDAVFLLIWGLHCFCVLVIISLILFVVISYQSSESKISFARKLVYQVLSLLLSILRIAFGIPTTIILTAPVFCTHNCSCWSGSYAVISVFSALLLLAHFVGLATAAFYVDSHVQSGLPWAGPDSKSGMTFQLLKCAIGLYIAADYSLNSGIYIYIFIILWGALLMYQMNSGKSIYNRLIRWSQWLKISVFFWATLGMYICSVTQVQVDFGVGAITIIASIFISVAWYIRQQQKVVQWMQEGVTTLGNECAVVNAMSLLTEYTNEIDKNPQATWLLVGVLHLHKNTCRNENCVCRTLETASQPEEIELNEDFDAQQGNPRGSSGSSIMASLYHRDLGTVKSRITFAKQEPEARVQNRLRRWREFIGVLFDEISKAYPHSVDANLFVAYYQELMSKNYYKAFFQMWKVLDEECSLGQQLAVYRMKALLNKEICNYESSQSSASIDLDLNIYVKFESKRRELEQEMQDCTQKVMQFWGLLLSVNLKIDKMYVLGGQISCGLQRTHVIFEDITKIFPDHIKTYNNYSAFLREVANNEIESEEYQDKAEQISRNLDLGKGQTYAENSIFSINRETAIVITSGNPSTLATILHANEYMQEIFGYSYNNLIGFSINRIMPKLISTVHNKFMQQFYETGSQTILNSERLLFGQSKYGLLIPVAIIVKTMPGIDDGIKYIGFIRRDITYIKRNLIKLPYQYQKSNKIGFIMTDPKGNINGISDKAAKTLGIPSTYFEKKKAVFSETLNISRMNKKLTKPEAEAELNKGTILEIKVRHIPEMIDKDFLTPEEITALEQQTRITVYIQLMTYEYSFGTKYNIYVIVPVKGDNASMARPDDMKDEDSNGPELNVADTMGESVSSTASVGGLNDKLRPLYKELKKSTFERHESRHILLMKRIIYLSLLVIFGLSMADLVYYMLCLERVGNLFKLMESSYYRMNSVQTMLQQFQSYRNLAMGTEEETTDYDTDRLSHLRDGISTYLQDIKDNEYTFQERVKGVNIGYINEICVSPGVNYVDIFVDSQIGTARQGLGITIIQMVSKVNRIINEVALSDMNTTFIQSIYEQDLQVDYKLSQTEKDTYFVILNGLHNVINATQLIEESAEDNYHTTMRHEKILYYALHIVRWAIYLIVILVTIPLIQRVQSGKRAILQFFAEVPKKRIELILKDCENFYNKQQNFMNLEAKNETYKKARVPGEIESNFPAGSSFLGTRHSGSWQTLGDDRLQKQDSNGNLVKEEVKEEAGKEKAKGEPEKKENAEEAEAQGEESFREERRKKFMAYKAGIGLIFLFFLISMLSIAGYQSGIFGLQVHQSNLLDENLDFVNLLQKRWFYSTTTMVYFLATTQTSIIMDPDTGNTMFIAYCDKLAALEDKINTVIIDHPSNQDKVAKMLESLVDGVFCDVVYNLGIDFPDYVNSTWCSEIKNGVLEHGIRSSIFFVVSELKSFYIMLLTQASTDTGYSLQDNKLMFEYIMVPTFDFVIKEAADTEYKLVNQAEAVFIVQYIAMFIVMLIALFVLIKYFADRLNTELWNAKGFITLLPLDLIEKNKGIRELFSQQMNVIF